MPANSNPLILHKLFVLALFAISFLVQVEHLIMVPLSSDIALELGMPITYSGFLVSIYLIAAAISAFFLAPFSDRMGRKKMLLILIVGFSLSSLGCAFAQSTETMFLFRILSGVFGGIITPNALAYVGDLFDGEQRIRALSSLTLSFPIASVLGVPLGAWIGDWYSWRVPFGVMALASLLCGAAILYIPAIAGTTQKSILQQYRELLALWRTAPIRMIFTIQFFMLIGLFGFVPNLSPFLTVNFDMSTTEIGLCYMQGGIGAIIGNLAARQLMQRHFKASLISVGSLIMGCILLAVTTELLGPSLVGLAFALTMFGGSLRMPALQVILSDLVSSEMRGRLMAMSMIVANVTMGLGGLWSAPLLSMEGDRLSGMDQIGWISFLTLCLVPLLVYRYLKLFRT